MKKYNKKINKINKINKNKNIRKFAAKFIILIKIIINKIIKKLKIKMFND